MNSNYARWIKQSIAKHFNTNKSYLAFRYEAENKKSYESEKNRFELRIDGPDIVTSANNVHTLSVAVNCLVETIEAIEDIFQHSSNVGLVQSLFVNGIPIYNDSNLIIECLTREQQVNTVDYGKIKGGINLEQTTIEAVYTAILRE